MTDEKHVVTATRVTPDELRRIQAEEREEAKSSRERARFARQTFDHGRGSVDLAMTRLCRAFPSLDHAAGVDPFDVLELAAWARGGKSHGEIVTVRFILSVWNTSEARDGTMGPDDGYRLAYFDLHEALGVWDRYHQQAFAGWIDEPWWP